ncbi:hypothetical protein B7P43_G18084 [Cryptotermes secundus]|uniref:Uncharacterized protein n=1 Tax=Cryptotermes secundus TaxID=105785 RepID=A0A2J7PMC5_9NEOP|nr:hypothetical protein B7P43_G18084 [Cryptotermes secundus]
MTQWSGGKGVFIVDRQTLKMNPEVEDHLSLRNQELWHRWKALILSDGHITIEAIVDEVCISHGSVFSIIHDKLHMTKVTVRWVS